MVDILKHLAIERIETIRTIHNFTLLRIVAVIHRPFSSILIGYYEWPLQHLTIKPLEI